MNKVQKTFLAVAVLFLASGVVLGALGAHALEEMLTPERLDSYKTAVRYQMWMAGGLFMLQLAWKLDALKDARLPSLLLILGMIFFSGSIYLLVLLPEDLGIRSVLGPITPLGGVLLIIAWTLVLVGILRKPAVGKQ